MLGSLLVAMILYVAMSLVLTGMVPYPTLNNPAPVANAFLDHGLHAVSTFISLAAIAGITSVLIAFSLGAARVWFPISRDGLLPGWFAAIHPKHRTPHRPTWIIGAVTAAVAGFTPIEDVATLVNIGVLTAFVIVCVAVLVLRRTRPDARRSFRTPWMPVVPLVGIGFSIWLISSLEPQTWWRFGT